MDTGPNDWRATTGPDEPEAPRRPAETLLGTTDVVQRPVSDAESVTANRRWWDADAEDYLAEHGEFLGSVDFLWCPEGLRESAAGLLGELPGRRVLEIGCGSAPCARWLATLGCPGRRAGPLGRDAATRGTGG